MALTTRAASQKGTVRASYSRRQASPSVRDEHPARAIDARVVAGPNGPSNVPRTGSRPGRLKARCAAARRRRRPRVELLGGLAWPGSHKLQ